MDNPQIINDVAAFERLTKGFPDNARLIDILAIQEAAGFEEATQFLDNACDIKWTLHPMLLRPAVAAHPSWSMDGQHAKRSGPGPKTLDDLMTWFCRTYPEQAAEISRKAAEEHFKLMIGLEFVRAGEEHVRAGRCRRDFDPKTGEVSYSAIDLEAFRAWSAANKAAAS